MLQPCSSRLLICFALAPILVSGCAEISNTSSPPQVSSPTVTPSTEIKSELEQYFQGFTGAFVFFDLNDNRYIRFNSERCAERFLPASTFKIMNSLIGLETGVIPDENYVIPWDGTPYDVPAWNRDHTLKTAIQNSVVWYYQELARRVGQARMQQYIDTANYGNKDISGQIDTFWLEGGLRISADEQVAFLERLYRGDLPFSQRAMATVKEILVLEKTTTYQFSGKTGTVQRVAPRIGWFVGYIEEASNVYFFATNIESQDVDASGDKAREISRTILQSFGLLQ